jgi:glycosyltransferase involved in cell wall biosynthesis
MKINIFTPLPDLRTDIANMSACVLHELGKVAQVRAWTSQSDWSVSPDETYEVHRFEPGRLPIRAFNWSDVNFFNLGNDSRFHKDIFDVSRRLPGIQILHDVRLAHFFAAYAAGDDGDRAFYVDEMDRAGLGGEVRKFLKGELPFSELVDRETMVATALRHAIAGIVHNEAELDAIAAVNRTPILYLPLCLAKPLGPAPVRAGRADDGEGRLIRLIIFGFIGTNRCLPEVLQALAGMADKDRYVLDVYGTLEEHERVTSLIGTLGLQSHVHHHGFVAEDVLDAALARAELAINLRNPTMGEASGSQLRIWASALPSLVSNTGWYATLPKDTVFPVEHGQEIASVQDHLRSLRRNPARYRMAGRRGRIVLERDHQPAAYAGALLEIARQVPAMFARKTATDLAHRAAARLLDITRSSDLPEITHSVAVNIQAIGLQPHDPTR